MKIQILILFVFIVSVNALANCEDIECYSPCAHAKVTLKGDKCSLTWNKAQKCFEAYTECGESKKCIGALCLDHCEGKNIYFPKANTCTEYFDAGQMCWRADGVCE